MTAPLPPPESARLMALYSAATAAAEIFGGDGDDDE